MEKCHYDKVWLIFYERMLDKRCNDDFRIFFSKIVDCKFVFDILLNNSILFQVVYKRRDNYIY